MKKNNVSLIKVSIIIPTFNRFKYLYPCLLCLLKQETSFFYEIIIIDSGNDNTNSVVSNLKKIYGDFLVYKKINQATNRAKLRNLGAKIAKGEILVFLDNDILVDMNFVQNHYNISLKNPNSIILGKRKSLVKFLPEAFINNIVINHYSDIDKLGWIIDARDVFFGPGKNSFDDNKNQWRFLYSHNFLYLKKILKN